MKKKMFCTLLLSIMMVMTLSVFAKEKTEQVNFDGGGYGFCKVGIQSAYAWASSVSEKPTVDVRLTRITGYEQGGGSRFREGLYSADVSSPSTSFVSAQSYHLFDGKSYFMTIYQ